MVFGIMAYPNIIALWKGINIANVRGKDFFFVYYSMIKNLLNYVSFFQSHFNIQN